MQTRPVRRFVFLLALLACAALPALADGTAAAQYRSGTLRVDLSATEVSLQLRLPMTRADAASAGKHHLSPAEVVARLKAGDKVFTFPPEGRCVVENASAFVVDGQGRPTTGDGNIQAMYRFNCAGAASSPLTRLSVRLFEELPGLEKLRLQLDTGKGERTEDLNPAAAEIAL